MKCLKGFVFLACLACCYPSSIINRKDPSPSPSVLEEVSNSTIITEEALEESIDNDNGTDRMNSYFPNYPYPGHGLGGGVGGGGIGIGIPNVPPFGNTILPQWGGQGCRHWCPGYGRSLQCCDGNSQRVPKCPGERATCPFSNRSFGVPRLCTTHVECYQYRELCCYDVCIRQRVCKPPE